MPKVTMHGVELEGLLIVGGEDHGELYYGTELDKTTWWEVFVESSAAGPKLEWRHSYHSDIPDNWRRATEDEVSPFEMEQIKLHLEG